MRASFSRLLALAAVGASLGCTTSSSAADSGAASAGAATAAAAPSRASSGDTVLIVLNPIRADRRADFEAFLHAFWSAGLASTDPVTRRAFTSTRVLDPVHANADGSWTYVFVMDPLLPQTDYDMSRLLPRVVPADSAETLMKLLSASRAGAYTAIETTQSAVPGER